MTERRLTSSTRRNNLRSTLQKAHSAPRLLVDYSKCKAPVEQGLRHRSRKSSSLFDGISSQRSLFESTSDHQSRKDVRRRTSAQGLAAMMGDEPSPVEEQDPFRPINLSCAKNPVLGSSFSSLMDIFDQNDNHNNNLSALNVSFRVRKSSLVEFNDGKKLEESRFTSSFSTLQRSVIDSLARMEEPNQNDEGEDKKVCKRSLFAAMKATSNPNLRVVGAMVLPSSGSSHQNFCGSGEKDDNASSCSSTSRSSSKVVGENTMPNRRRGGGILADSSRLSRSFYDSERIDHRRFCNKSNYITSSDDCISGSKTSNDSQDGEGDWFLRKNHDDVLLIDDSEASLQSSLQRLRVNNNHAVGLGTTEQSTPRDAMDIEWKPPAVAAPNNHSSQRTVTDASRQQQKPVPSQVKDISWQKPLGGTPLAATTKRRSKSCNNLLLTSSPSGGGRDHRRKSFTRNPLGDMVSLLELHDSSSHSVVMDKKTARTRNVQEQQHYHQPPIRRRRSHQDLRSLLESNPAKRSSMISCRIPSSRNVVCDISVASTIESVSTFDD